MDNYMAVDSLVTEGIKAWLATILTQIFSNFRSQNRRGYSHDYIDVQYTTSRDFFSQSW